MATKIGLSKRKNRCRKFVKRYLNICSCKDCQEKDWRVLDFDHLRDKKATVASLVQRGSSIDRLKEEIRKCEVVCSNCHRLRTYSRLKVCYKND